MDLECITRSILNVGTHMAENGSLSMCEVVPIPHIPIFLLEKGRDTCRLTLSWLPKAPSQLSSLAPCPALPKPVLAWSRNLTSIFKTPRKKKLKRMDKRVAEKSRTNRLMENP